MSQVSPCFLASQPTPPPRVKPATPVLDTTPAGTARPKTCGFTIQLPEQHAGLTRARRSLGSTWMPFMRDRSITIPPSHSARPPTLWPPPRTATSSPCSRAKRTAAITSARPLHRAISPGRLSMLAFQIFLALSYSASPLRTTDPRNAATNGSIAATSTGVPSQSTKTLCGICPPVVLWAEVYAAQPSPTARAIAIAPVTATMMPMA